VPDDPTTPDPAGDGGNIDPPPPDSPGFGDPASIPSEDAERSAFRTIIADPAIRAIILVSFVTALGVGIVWPIIPLFARSFGVGYRGASVMVASFAFTRLIFDLVAGPLVDRHGERIMAALGVGIVGVSSLLTGLAPSFALAVAFRAAGGAGSSMYLAALFSYLVKVAPQHRVARTLSIFYASFNIGIIAGEPVGGLIAQRFGLASPLIFYAGLAFLAGLMFLRFIRDPQPERDPLPLSRAEASAEREMPGLRRIRLQALGLLKIRAFVTVITAVFVYSWLLSAVLDTLVPLFGRDRLGMSTVGIGGALAVAMTVELLVVYPAGSLVDRIGRKPVLIAAMIGLGISTASVGLVGTALAMAGVLALVGLSMALGDLPAISMLSDVAPGEDTGTAVGIYRFCTDLGMVVGPLVAGATATAFGFRAAFAIAACPVLVVLALAARTPETLARKRNGPDLPPITGRS